MSPAYDRSPADDARVLAVGVTALALGVAIGALVMMMANNDPQSLRAGASQKMADLHDKALDLLRAGREKLERSAERS